MYYNYYYNFHDDNNNNNNDNNNFEKLIIRIIKGFRALARNEKHPAFSKELGKSKGRGPLHTP